MEATDLSPLAAAVLCWMADLEGDPQRRACLYAGTTLAAQAVADGVVESLDELPPALRELRDAGMIDWANERADQ